ncbi:GbsR/MarR family transcriptional regulator [Brevibacillus sp. H7]|uniref:GbsR/MarR family transcriptional regulator n=1 Tax=Brevibacillus sp. H7 TaxID=3349138 RepID=UPI003829BE65
MNGMERLQKARQRVIESIANNIDLYGVTHSIGRMYGTMYFEEEPMTLEALGEALGMSKTSMSAGVRVLTDLKMVDKVWVKGVRKDLYRAEEDWYQTFIDFFAIRWRKAVQTNVEMIQKSLSELDGLIQDESVEQRVKELALSDKEKLHNALAYYQWLTKLIASLESYEIFQFIPKPDKEK